MGKNRRAIEWLQAKSVTKIESFLTTEIHLMDRSNFEPSIAIAVGRKLKIGVRQEENDNKPQRRQGNHRRKNNYEKRDTYAIMAPSINGRFSPKSSALSSWKNVSNRDAVI